MARFLDGTLVAEQWTHPAHLFVCRHVLATSETTEVAVERLRRLIQAHNDRVGLRPDQGGYHETITRIWLSLVADARRRHPAADSEAFLAAAGPELEVSRVFTHYTKEYLMGTRARAVFVPADLLPLPA